MRYDTTIYFQTTTAGEYDEASGYYGQDKVEETAALASVMDTSRETMHLLFGEIRQGTLTVQLLNHYDAPFDRIRIGEKVYSVKSRRRLRTKETFIICEVA